MIPSSRVILLTGTVIAMIVLPAIMTPLPVRRQTRSLVKDQDLLIQKGGGMWVGAPVQLTHKGKVVIRWPGFFCTKGKDNVTVIGHDDFLKKPGPNGLFFLGLADETGTTGYGVVYYRLEEKEKKRYLVLCWVEPGKEYRYSYELEGKVLKLSGGDKLPHWLGDLDLSGEYEKTK